MKIKLLVSQPDSKAEQSTVIAGTTAGKEDKPRGTNRFYEADQPSCIIGREADLLIDHDRVSRQHALLYESFDGELILRDLESRNGTFLNGEPIKECSVRVGDVIAIGKVTLTVLDFQPKNVAPSEPVRRRARRKTQDREENTITGTGVLVGGSDKIFRAIPPKAQEKFADYLDEVDPEKKDNTSRARKKATKK